MTRNKFTKIIAVILLIALFAGMLAGCSLDLDMSMLKDLIGEKDRADLSQQSDAIANEENLVDPADFYVGNTVYFGSFEQDNNPNNGTEPILWEVVDTENGRALLVSKYILDSRAYHTVDTNITWDRCALRGWLNGEFLGTAFSAQESELIETTSVYGGGHPEFTTDNGAATQDKVFLLSYSQVKQYYGSEYARQCSPTSFAISRGVDVEDGHSWWWLRSPGRYQYFALGVRSNGELFNSGDKVAYTDGGVRPAIWITFA